VTPDEYIAELDEPRRSQIRELRELIRETAPALEPTVEHRQELRPLQEARGSRPQRPRRPDPPDG